MSQPIRDADVEATGVGGMRKVTRRSFLATVGAAAGCVATPVAIRPALALAACDSTAPGYRFFSAAEARFIEAACNRLIPSDPAGPGALDAGVPRYLDEHLAGAWGNGRQTYRNGPWQPGTPPVHVSGRAPAELFRSAMAGILRDLAARGLDFPTALASAQSDYLGTLAAGAGTLAGVPTSVFFDMLLAMTVEGFFSHPRLGATRDRVAWPLRGFPGSHARA